MGQRQNGGELRSASQNVTTAGVKCWYEEEAHGGVTAAPRARGSNSWAFQPEGCTPVDRWDEATGNDDQPGTRDES